MKLWIRSQNRQLIKKANYEICYNERNGHNYIVIDGDVLGSYTTKERALEILDEIQNIIKPRFINTEYHSEIKQDVDKLSSDVVMQPVENEITYIQPNAVVYEMPKE